MKNMCLVLFVTTAVLITAGCVSSSNTLPRTCIGMEPLKTTATYDIIGDAVGTATGGMLFGFIPIGSENKYGNLTHAPLLMNDKNVMNIFGAQRMSPVESAAIYNAIESVPTADALLAPRFTAKRSNYVIYSEETITVKGKAIRYNVSAGK